MKQVSLFQGSIQILHSCVGGKLDSSRELCRRTEKLRYFRETQCKLRGAEANEAKESGTGRAWKAGKGYVSLLKECCGIVRRRCSFGIGYGRLGFSVVFHFDSYTNTTTALYLTGLPLLQ